MLCDLLTYRMCHAPKEHSLLANAIVPLVKNTMYVHASDFTNKVETKRKQSQVVCTPLTEYPSQYLNTMLCKSHTLCGLSCTDVGEIKCLSYQKRTPRGKSPDYDTRDGASVCCVTQSKQAPYVSVNSGFIQPLGNSITQMIHLL